MTVRLARRGFPLRLGAAEAGALALAACLLWRDPRAAGAYPPCPFNALTGGLLCPGCGSMRCLRALLGGGFAEALHDNALACAAIPFLAALTWDDLRVAAGGEGWRWPRRPVVGRIVLVATVAFWVLRNLPVAPFTFLAPLPVG